MLRLTKPNIRCQTDGAGSNTRYVDACAVLSTSDHSALRNNLAWRFLESCDLNAERVACSYQHKSLSYAELRFQALQLATMICQHPEFLRGGHIGLSFENSIEYIVGFYGILLAGGVVIPIPVRCSETQRAEFFRLADIDLMLESAAVVGELGLEATVADDSPETSNSFGKFQFSAPGCIALMLFTSGSSGVPKAVELSHRNLIANSESILKFLPIEKQDRALAVAPFSHALGNSVLQTHLLTGAELVVAQRHAYAADVLAALKEFACTSLTAVPEVFVGLAQQLDRKSLPSLKYLAVAGGKLAPAIAVNIQQQLGPESLFLMYGQTEATARLAWLPPEYLKADADCIGIAAPGVQLRVVDDDGNSVAIGRVGKLVAKGDNVMRGYYNDESATRSVIVNGWLNTGDLARQRNNGLFEICGRSNGLVKVMGHRFHPVEVERMVAAGLEQTQIVVTPFEFYGNTRIALFARPDRGRTLEKSELKRVCRELLPIHMMPQRYQIIESWPLNSAGKINRLCLAKNISKIQDMFQGADYVERN